MKADGPVPMSRDGSSRDTDWLSRAQHGASSGERSHGSVVACAFVPPGDVYDEGWGGIDQVRWAPNPWGDASASQITEGCAAGVGDEWVEVEIDVAEVCASLEALNAVTVSNRSPAMDLLVDEVRYE